MYFLSVCVLFSPTLWSYFFKWIRKLLEYHLHLQCAFSQFTLSMWAVRRCFSPQAHIVQNFPSLGSFQTQTVENQEAKEQDRGAACDFPRCLSALSQNNRLPHKRTNCKHFPTTPAPLYIVHVRKKVWRIKDQSKVWPRIVPHFLQVVTFICWSTRKSKCCGTRANLHGAAFDLRRETQT